MRAVLALFACLFLAATVTAAKDPAAAGSYCSLDITTRVLQCHETAEELSRSLELAGVATGDTAPRMEAQASTQQASVIGTIYEHSGYGGGYLNIVGDSCWAGYTDFIDLTWTGWNDRLSSFIGGSGCRLYLHENWNGTGAGYGWASASSWVGSMNDRTSSISFSP
jgi:hypothetical protein